MTKPARPTLDDRAMARDFVRWAETCEGDIKYARTPIRKLRLAATAKLARIAAATLMGGRDADLEAESLLQRTVGR